MTDEERRARHRENNRRYREKHRDRVLAQQRKYRADNQEKVRREARERARRNYRDNPEKHRAAAREYARRNPKEIRERAQKYRTKNRNKLLAAMRLWHAQNKEWEREYRLRYLADNPEKAREATQRWRAKNRDRLREYDREKGRQRYANPVKREQATSTHRYRHHQRWKDDPEYRAAKRADWQRWAAKKTPEWWRQRWLVYYAKNTDRLREKARGYCYLTTAAVQFLRTIGLWERGPTETCEMRRRAALAFVREAGLLDMITEGRE